MAPKEQTYLQRVDKEMSAPQKATKTSELSALASW
jgi:hypothetical protein